MKVYTSRNVGLISGATAMTTAAQLEQSTELTVDSKKVVVFYPTLVTLIAFEYVGAMADICAKSHMPFVKEVRTIKQNKDEYMNRSFYGVSYEDKTNIIESVYAVCDKADSNIDTLWNTTKYVICKQHPDIDEKRLMMLANGVISLLFLSIAVKVARCCKEQVECRTNIELTSLVDIYTVNVYNACCRIVHDYNIPCTPMMKRSAKAVVRKVADELKKRINKGKI